MPDLICAWHTCNNILTGRQTRFCSTKCKTKFFVDKRRKRLKQMAVDYKGGKCEICGYDRCIWALQFHHRDPATKDFAISATGTTRSWERVKREVAKCYLVCANCHAEIHAGILMVAEGFEPPTLSV